MNVRNLPVPRRDVPADMPHPMVSSSRPPMTGWAGLIETLLHLRNDQIAPWAIIVVVLSGLWFGFVQLPTHLRSANADFTRLLQEESERNRMAVREEWERNRLFTADRDKQIMEAFRGESDKQMKWLFQVIQKLGADMGRLEQAIDALRKRMEPKSGGGDALAPERLPMPRERWTFARILFTLGVGPTESVTQ